MTFLVTVVFNVAITGVGTIQTIEAGSFEIEGVPAVDVKTIGVAVGRLIMNLEKEVRSRYTEHIPMTVASHNVLQIIW